VHSLFYFCLFGSCVLTTLESIADVRSANEVPSDYETIVEAMAELPAGNAVVPPVLGNLLPAYSSHQVWVGQWFLTPDYKTKKQQFQSLVEDPESMRKFSSTFADQSIDYLVLPVANRKATQTILADQIENVQSIGEFDLYSLKR